MSPAAATVSVPLPPADIEALERATLAAVPPQALVALDGWLLGLDDGTVGRAHSAVPTRHDGLPQPQASLDAIESRYAARGLRPVLRVPRVPALDGLRGVLETRGYAASQATLTLVGGIDGLCALTAGGTPPGVALAAAPDDAWTAAFLGVGTDPADAASRLAILRRATGTAFASVVQGGQVVAVGTAGFGHGWCGIHGMRTAPAWRGRGLAGAILAAFGREAAARGLARCFLQVEAGNTAALALYRRAGLHSAWCYDYWRRSERPPGGGVAAAF